MRLLVSLLVAAALSLAAGLAVSHMVTLIPCQGEGLACNINDAVGAYAVLIWTAIGTLVLGAVLLLARGRVSLAGGAVLLAAPLVLFVLSILVEAWQTIGFEPYRNLREAIVILLPPVATILTQWLVLHFGFERRARAEVVRTAKQPEAKAPPPQPPTPTSSAGGFSQFPTE